MRQRQRDTESLPAQPGVTFGPFRLTEDPLCLWQGQTRIPLQPRPLAVLHYFVTHPQTLISNDALRQAVWGRTVVSPTTVQVCVREVRKALGEKGTTAQYIETVGRDGYRFIAPVAARAALVSRSTSHVPRSTPSPTAKSDSEDRLSAQPETWNLKPETVLVGRDAELIHLHQLWAKAQAGERQVVFVTGEAGIGKTTVVDAFLGGARLWELGSSSSPVPSPNPKSQSPEPAPWIGRGQCIEHYGEGEPYLPVLEAIGQLCQGPSGARVVAALRRYAPTWLLHLPGLVASEEQDALPRQGASTTQGQMLREITDALEAISQEHLVILVFEDLHVSDPSTVELLTYLAQRRTRARVLILGTYRPIDVVLRNHPIRERAQTLLVRGHAHHLALELLSETDITAYLHQRLAATTLPASLAQQVHRQTDGNALFVTRTVEYLLEHQRLVDTAGHWQLAGPLTSEDIPQTLHQLILTQVDNLPPEHRQVLEMASVEGATFTAASVAAGLDLSTDTADDLCEQLTRGPFIAVHGLATWPDGTVSGEYTFRHALYQEVLYQQVRAGRQARVHRVIGERKEHAYAGHTQEIAAELALHFERGLDYPRTVSYLQQAAETALRRYAYQEARLHLDKELTFLRQLPATLERDRQELALQLALATVLRFTVGLAAPVVGEAYRRAVALALQLEDWTVFLRAARGLHQYFIVESDLPAALTLAQQSVEVAQRLDDAAAVVEPLAQLGTVAFWLGDFVAARLHLERSCALYESSWSASLTLLYSEDLKGDILSYLSWTLWFLGYPDQAVQTNQAALSHVRNVAHPYSLTFALYFAARVCQLRRDAAGGQRYLDELQELAQRHGFAFWHSLAELVRAWTTAELDSPEKGIQQFRAALQSYTGTGAGLSRSYQTPLLAEMYGKSATPDEGFVVLAEAESAARRSGEAHYTAERLRIRGEILLQQFHVSRSRLYAGRSPKSKVQSQKKSENLDPTSQIPDPSSEAAVCFRKAIEIARQQQAKSLELRAVMSLVRLRQQQAAEHGVNAALAEVHQMLSEVYGWFTEGFATADLQEAKALLEDLGGSGERGKRGKG